MSNEATRRQPLAPPSRSEAVRFSIASTTMEGLAVTNDMKRLLHQWAEGGIDNDELIRRSLEAEPVPVEEVVFVPGE